jgi:hypothetical protein
LIIFLGYSVAEVLEAQVKQWVQQDWFTSFCLGFMVFSGKFLEFLGLIGAELTIVQSRISLVNKIQKVYRSQGVQIHNRHIELIVRQITSKVLVSEDGMSNVFLPGELIGLFRAERMGRALEEAIHYRSCLIGNNKSVSEYSKFHI